jgi:hypothetical protein
MDDLDALEELERMAHNAEYSRLTDTLPSAEDIKRWMRLFKYNHIEAEALIIAHRSDLTRVPITDEHWSLVALDLQSRGYDREAYEHSLGLKDLMKSQSTVVHDSDGHRWTLFRLGGLLESQEKIKDIAGLEQMPKVTTGIGSRGMSDFVWVDDAAREKIEHWIEGQQGGKVGGEGSN